MKKRWKNDRRLTLKEGDKSYTETLGWALFTGNHLTLKYFVWVIILKTNPTKTIQLDTLFEQSIEIGHKHKTGNVNEAIVFNRQPMFKDP